VLSGCGSSAPKVRMSADSWQPAGSSLESGCSASSAHGTAHTEAQRHGLLSCLATSNFKSIFGSPCREPPRALLQKCERLQVAGSKKGLACKAVSQPHMPMALLAQRHRDWGCLLVLPHQTSNVALEWGWCLPGSFLSSGAKMRRSADSCQPEGACLESCSSASSPKTRTSAYSWQPEGASLESCFSASSAHGTDRTEAQRLGLLACPAISNFKQIFGCPSMVPAAMLVRKCERLQIAGSQKWLAWKSVAQPHLPMALLAQRHRDWGCLIVLPHQTSKSSLGVGAVHLQDPCSETANVCR